MRLEFTEAEGKTKYISESKTVFYYPDYLLQVNNRHDSYGRDMFSLPQVQFAHDFSFFIL